MKAVIVAAGRGKRLMPFTADMPKPLLPIHGTPLLEYLLRGLRWSGITDVVIVVRYLGEKIQEAFGDGSRLDMKLEYAYQQGPDGTGSALLSAEDFMDDEPFMLLWGDVLMNPENYKRIQELYAKNPCALLSTLNWLDDPSTGASVMVDGYQLISIEEKPAPGTARSNWNQAGLFICTQTIFTALHECSLSPRGEIEFTSGVQKLLDSGQDVRWMKQEGFWSDVGTPELLARLNADNVVADLLR